MVSCSPKSTREWLGTDGLLGDDSPIFKFTTREPGHGPRPDRPTMPCASGWPVFLSVESPVAATAREARQPSLFAPFAIQQFNALPVDAYARLAGTELLRELHQAKHDAATSLQKVADLEEALRGKELARFNAHLAAVWSEFNQNTLQALQPCGGAAALRGTPVPAAMPPAPSAFVQVQANEGRSSERQPEWERHIGIVSPQPCDLPPWPGALTRDSNPSAAQARAVRGGPHSKCQQMSTLGVLPPQSPSADPHWSQPREAFVAGRPAEAQTTVALYEDASCDDDFLEGSDPKLLYCECCAGRSGSGRLCSVCGRPSRKHPWCQYRPCKGKRLRLKKRLNWLLAQADRQSKPVEQLLMSEDPFNRFWLAKLAQQRLSQSQAAQGECWPEEVEVEEAFEDDELEFWPL